MKITQLEAVQRRPRKVAIGTFDGVHLGHQAVIQGCDTVLTFDPHPVAVVRPDAAPKLLTNNAVKAELIAALGVRELVIIPFGRAFSERSAQAFIDQILVSDLQAELISVGENFRFGKRAQGDPTLLSQDARFQTRITPLIEVAGEAVSSSQLRTLVMAGEVDRARLFLDAPFQLRGEVVYGDQRGRELGFPTANLRPDERLVIPNHGVYAGLANGLLAAISIGVRPTFEAAGRELIEAFIVDFEGDLYGQELKIEFLKKLRAEQKFSSAAALIEQMQRDVEATRAVHADYLARH